MDRHLDLNLNLINANLPGFSFPQGVGIRQGQIAEIRAGDNGRDDWAGVEVLDLEGDWISLGGWDLQINGALGLAFPDIQRSDWNRLEQICNFLWEQGIDGFLPTVVTTSLENIQRSLQVFAEWIPQQSPNTAQVLGVHLEGPCLNFQKRGAHPPEYLLPLTVDYLKQILGDYGSIVKIITLAPELDETGTTLRYLKDLGMTVSLGHSQATAIQAQAAFDQGATMVTHGFNAMPGLHHRESGLLGAALVHPQVHCGFIADGQHIGSTMLDLLVRIARGQPKGTQDSTLHNSVWAICSKLFLVSDALAPLGLPDGIYPWDQRQIQVTQGTARLPEGTLAGTTLPLLAGVENLVNWGICEMAEAIALATIAPRQALAEFTWVGQSAHQLLRWQYSQGALHWQRLRQDQR